ncbi:hypothetical protein U9941_24055, partial [Escherichia coli]
IAIFSCVVRRLRFSGPKTSIICSPMTSLKTSIKTITYLSDIGYLEIQGASLDGLRKKLIKNLSIQIKAGLSSGLNILRV